MKAYYENVARTYLLDRRYSGKKLEEILSGFDFTRPTYEQRLDEKAIIYQFVRNSLDPKLGNWFCLPGASLSSLAIFSGGEGRQIAKIRVDVPFTALEGTAAPQSINWHWSGGGKGGATQIFVPENYLISNLSVLGYSNRFE